MAHDTPIFKNYHSKELNPVKNMEKQNSLTKAIINFVKYNDAFVIGLVLVLFGGGAIFAASPDARSAVLGKEVVTLQGIDNSRIINANLENFDFQVKIDNVTEDQANYYIDYSFRTLGVEGNEWQTITRNAKMTVAKESLAGQDLGLYVQAQLANIAQNELAYLKQAQAAEKEKGLTQIVRTTEYTGLIGLVLDTKNQTLPGYEPVVKPEPVELAQDAPQPQELPLEPEILQEPALAENATTTPEIATGEPQGQAEAAEPAQTRQTPETQPQAPENGNTNVTITTPEPANPESAAITTEPETSEPTPTEPATTTTITSENSEPDVSATSTTEE